MARMPKSRTNRGKIAKGDQSMRVRGSVLLVVGFTALLLVLAASAFAVWRNARNAQNRVAALHTAHLEAGSALSAIRASVYLAGILTRDYLLDPDPSNALKYVNQFQEIRARTEESFTTLEAQQQSPEQRAALSRLRSELEQYWDPTEVVLDWSPEEKRAQRAEMLRQRVRQREDIFALSQQVEHLMSENFERERQRITSADQEFRYSLGWTAALALLLGAGIAAVTLARVLSLERQSQMAESELRLLSGEIRTAQEQERKYLSRELHDQVGQMLTGLRMELTGIARTSGGDESDFASRIAHAKGTVEQTLRIVRNIAMLLRPSMLDDLGLSPALSWLLKEVSRTSGIEIEAEVDPAVDALPDSHRTCIYRVVQEALTNASRHSGARKLELALSPEGDWVLGTIADDGRGFESGVARRRGLGLLGMEERVRELGGSIRFLSQPGRGTRVEFRLPRPAGTEISNDANPHRGRSRDRSDRVEASA
jgi:two-component sensor histidine kinase